MPDQIVPVTWGASVEEVLALAPHVLLATPPAGGSGTWVDSQAGKTTTAQVERWIQDVAAMVDLRLRKRSKLTDPDLVGRVERGAKSLTVVGAAATMVSAVYPTKAGVNSQSSYSAELWARFNSEIDALTEALDEWILEEGTGGGPGKGSIGGTFPAPAFPDGMTW
ncbi:hypothetical protein ACSYDW_07095 [Paeniglutamicibacter sp. R2-26]|uniref:hypothetical protein n=1 Tax=Paeniglutamicibacter sp. R2-26 TaxID=3144417 RepID=UPI003EE7D281